MSQETPTSLDSFFASLSEANQKWMQQFVNSLGNGLSPQDAANPMAGAWNQMMENANQFIALQNNLYQQQMIIWLNFLGQPAAAQAQPAAGDRRKFAPEQGIQSSKGGGKLTYTQILS